MFSCASGTIHLCMHAYKNRGENDIVAFSARRAIITKMIYTRYYSVFVGLPLSAELIWGLAERGKRLLIYFTVVVIHSHSDAHRGSHGNASFHFLLTYACLHAFWLHFFSLGSSQLYDWLAKLISYSVLCLRRSDVPSAAIKRQGRADGQERDARTLRISTFRPSLNWSDVFG